LIGDLIILQSGGSQGMAISAYAQDSGERIWSAATDSVDYQSHGIFRIGKDEHLVFHGNQHLVGLNLKTGEERWSFSHGGTNSASATSGHPVEVSEGRLFVKNRGNGGVLVHISMQDRQYVAEAEWQTKNIGGTYIYPIYHDGLLFGYKGAILTALDATTGERLWRSREPGDGLPLIIDDHLVIITKEGKLSIAPASRDGYDETAVLQLFNDIVWSPASFANGKLYVRSMSEIACVEIVPKSGGDDLISTPDGVIPDTRFASFLEELSAAADKQTLLDSFLAENPRFPVIEGYSIAHFVYTGDAEEVTITGDHIGRRIEQPMHRVAGTGLFYYSSRLLLDARITYRFTTDLQHRTVDPRNPNEIRSLFFGQASWFGMPGWEQPAHLTPAGDGPVGKTDLVTFVSTADTHRVSVYLPPNYAVGSDHYPVVYLHDARRSFEVGKLDTSLDYLIGKTVAPIIPVVVPRFAGGGYHAFVGSNRDRYQSVFIDELIPFIDTRFRTIRTRTGRANYGTGNGGFMAFYTSSQNPKLLGGIAIQSTY
jgi:hypothetical protein